MDPQALFDVSGRTALITGCSSGFGAAFAEFLARCGANVVVAARRADRLDALVEKINSMPSTSDSTGKQQRPGRSKAVVLDLSRSEAEIEPAIEKAWEAFGAVDILVNNAGIGGTNLPNMEFDESDFDQVMAVNVRGLMIVSKVIGRKLIASKMAGNIINIASISGGTMLAPQYPGHAIYCSSKAAVVQCTRALALELAPHEIRVNCIAPGWFVTEISQDALKSPTGKKIKDATPMHKFGDVRCDLMGPLLMLASRNATGFMTGTVLTVDGGYTCQGPVRFSET